MLQRIEDSKVFRIMRKALYDLTIPNIGKGIVDPGYLAWRHFI